MEDPRVAFARSQDTESTERLHHYFHSILLRESPSGRWAKSTLQNPTELGWLGAVIQDACRQILVNGNTIISLIANHSQSSAKPRLLGSSRDFERVVNEVIAAIEVEGSIGYNLVEPGGNFALMKSELVNVSFFKDVRGRLGRIRCVPDEDSLGRFKEFCNGSRKSSVPARRGAAPRLTIKDPTTERPTKLRELLQEIREKAGPVTDAPSQGHFFENLATRIERFLDGKIMANPKLLKDLTNWLRIYHGLRIVCDNMASVIENEPQAQLQGDARWAVFTHRQFDTFINGLIHLPPHEEHSLRRERRIGLRQVALRPDLEILGLARRGGYLF
ncbi:hypothetical protein JCM16303_003298 [Sporobolomyces ruberrimus]